MAARRQILLVGLVVLGLGAASALAQEFSAAAAFHDLGFDAAV